MTTHSSALDEVYFLGSCYSYQVLSVSVGNFRWIPPLSSPFAEQPCGLAFLKHIFVCGRCCPGRIMSVHEKRGVRGEQGEREKDEAVDASYKSVILETVLIRFHSASTVSIWTNLAKLLMNCLWLDFCRTFKFTLEKWEKLHCIKHRRRVLPCNVQKGKAIKHRSYERYSISWCFGGGGEEHCLTHCKISWVFGWAVDLLWFSSSINKPLSGWSCPGRDHAHQDKMINVIDGLIKNCRVDVRWCFALWRWVEHVGVYGKASFQASFFIYYWPCRTG